MAQIHEAQRRRRSQTAGVRDLVRAVSAVLYRADHLGIAAGHNTDEYDLEAELVVIGLPGTAGPPAVQTLAHATYVACFDEQLAGPLEAYAEVAAQIWRLWEQHPRRGVPAS